MNIVLQYWLKPSTYNTAVGIYATLPFLMAPALFFVNAPYGMRLDIMFTQYTYRIK